MSEGGTPRREILIGLISAAILAGGVVWLISTYGTERFHPFGAGTGGIMVAFAAGYGVWGIVSIVFALFERIFYRQKKDPDRT